MSDRLLKNKITGVEWGINGVYQDRLVITSYENLDYDSTVHIFLMEVMQSFIWLGMI